MPTPRPPFWFRQQSLYCRRASSSLLLLLVAGLALIAGCSDSPPARGMGRHEPLAFHRAQDSGGPSAHIVESFQVPDDIKPWRIEGAKAERTEGVAGNNRLLIKGRKDRIVQIPADIDPRSFNQVVVRGIFRGVASLRVVLLSDGERKHGSSTLSSHNSRSEQHIVFDMPRLRSKRKHFTGLELHIAGRRVKEVGLDAIDLVYTPMSKSLPDPDGEHNLISIGHMARRGFGLTSTEPLQTEFEVKDADESLKFAHGQPKHLGLKGNDATLKLRLLDGEDAVFEDSYNVELDSWEDESIGLASWVGKKLRCELSLEGETGEEEIIALANFHVGRPAEAPPTVILISSDTHRGDHIGLLSDLVQTPHIDALGARGVTFEDAFAATNITSPSHVSMMTGMHPRDHRVVSNTGHMVGDARTLARVFQEAGYASIGLVSVRHLGPQGTGLGQGFERMKAPTHSTWTAERAVTETLDMMQEFEGRPLFVWLHLFEAHHPYEPPAEFDRRYYPDDKDPFDESLPEILGPDGAPLKSLSGARDIEYPKAQYRAEIDYLDQELGRLFAKPRVQKGITAFTADHGEILVNAGLYFNHLEIYPETLHVPLVLSWPGAPAGTRVKQPVRMLDIGRTLLDLAGHAGAAFPGRNLLGVLEGESKIAEVRYALSAHGVSASATKDGWHLILHLRNHQGMLPVERNPFDAELFDMNTDPACTTDLSQDPYAKAKGRELCQLLTTWLSEREGESLSTTGNRSAADTAALEGLGYAPNAEVIEDESWLDSGATACGCFD